MPDYVSAEIIAGSSDGQWRNPPIYPNEDNKITNPPFSNVKIPNPIPLLSKSEEAIPPNNPKSLNTYSNPFSQRYPNPPPETISKSLLTRHASAPTLAHASALL